MDMDSFWQGFDVAIKIVESVFDNSSIKGILSLWEEIEEEVDNYNKDG